MPAPLRPANVQRRALLRTSLGQHECSALEAQNGERDLARPSTVGRQPPETDRDHQVKGQKELFLQRQNHALPQPPHLRYALAEDAFDRRFNRTQPGSIRIRRARRLAI